MPTLSQFYGISIKMYFWESEHNPPHIHATYGGEIMEFSISSGKSLGGNLPKHVKKLVQLWLDEHREELLEIWRTQKFKKIKPLERNKNEGKIHLPQSK